MIETILGFLLDLIIGDPQNPIHPIRIIGSLCKVMEKFFRKVLKKSLKCLGESIIKFMTAANTLPLPLLKIISLTSLL